MVDAPPPALVSAVADLKRKLTPEADISDQVARQCDVWFCFGAKDSPVIVGDYCFGRSSFPGRISGWAILGGPSGSATFEVETCLQADFPGSLTSIVASAAPSGAIGASGSIPEVSTWTDAIARDTAWKATVTAVSGGLEVVTLAIRVKRLDL